MSFKEKDISVSYRFKGNKCSTNKNMGGELFSMMVDDAGAYFGQKEDMKRCKHFTYN